MGKFTLRKLPLLHLEQVPGGMIIRIVKPEEVGKMIWEACHQRPDIGAAFIVGIVGYCREHGITWADMEKMAEETGLGVNRE